MKCKSYLFVLRPAINVLCLFSSGFWNKPSVKTWWWFLKNEEWGSLSKSTFAGNIIMGSVRAFSTSLKSLILKRQFPSLDTQGFPIRAFTRAHVKVSLHGPRKSLLFSVPTSEDLPFQQWKISGLIQPPRTKWLNIVIWSDADWQ